MMDELDSQPILAKWGKEVASVCVGLLAVSIIVLAVIALVITDPNISGQAVTNLVTIRIGLICFGAVAFVMMLAVIAIADMTPSKAIRQLIIGFIGWYIFSGGSVLLLFVISSTQPPCSGFGGCFGRGLLDLGFFGASQIVLVFVLVFFERWLILIGMVSAFVMAFIAFIVVYGWPF